MVETLGNTLIVIFCVLIFLSQVAGIATFVVMLLRGKRITSLETEIAQLKTAVAGVGTDVGQAKKEVMEGQFNLADLHNKGVAALSEYTGKSAKSITDSVFDVIEKSTEDLLKLNTENSQKLYDALFVNIQLMNNLMSALGYRPTAPAEPGLQDPKRGQNYSAPPAPSDTF